MTGLERKAHRLVELARHGDDPTAAQLLSLHGAVAARIAAEGAIAASGTTATAKVASAGAFVKGLVAAAAIATGAAGYYVLQGSDAPAPAPVRLQRRPSGSVRDMVKNFEAQQQPRNADLESVKMKMRRTRSLQGIAQVAGTPISRSASASSGEGMSTTTTVQQPWRP